MSLAGKTALVTGRRGGIGVLDGGLTAQVQQMRVGQQ